MDFMYGPIGNVHTSAKDKAEEVKWLKNHVDEMAEQVDKLEQTVNEVAHFYSSMNKKQLTCSKVGSAAKDNKEKQIGVKKQQQDAAQREAASAKTMQELIRQFGTILRQIMREKWSWPFLHPVDVEGLGLHDYYEVIKKPMDLNTIKNKMEAKDGSEYKNIRDICHDVRLVFKNAMKYNDERNDYHVMARSMMQKFEEKWLLLVPKVFEEETRRKEEEAEAHLEIQRTQENVNAKLARDASNELHELDMHLDDLREMVVQNCRKMSAEEKRKLGIGLTLLSPEDLTKALEIIAQKNPNIQTTAEEVDVDMDCQSESTLWRLKFFVKEALKVKGKSSTTKVDNDYSKRKREICDALAKTAKKRSKKNVP